MCSRLVASGRHCPRTCRRRARPTPTSCCGTGTARWSASTTRSMSRRASAKDAMPARPRPSSTARAPKPLKKGQKPRSAGLRCWQEGHGPQAPHPRRYAWSLAERRRSPCRYPGPRWCGAGAQQANAATVPLHRTHLCRRRISGTTRPCRRRKNRHLEDRDHQTIRHRQRLRGLAKKMGGRENIGLDQPQPPPLTRWAKAGVWERVFKALTADRKNEYLMLDSTLVRAHQQAATGKGGTKIRLWGVPEED